MKSLCKFRRHATLFVVLSHLAFWTNASTTQDPLLAVPPPEHTKCEKSAQPAVRAALFGVADYPGPLKLESPTNDASLLGIAFKDLGVEDTDVLAGRVDKRAFVEKLKSLATLSRCGDTVILYFGGRARPRGDTALLLLSDLPADFDHHASAVANEATSGIVDGAELKRYFRGLQARGIHVFFVWDAIYDQGRAERDPVVQWRPLDAATETMAASEAGAFFGIYVEKSTELTLPIGVVDRKPYGPLSYAFGLSLFTTKKGEAFEALAATAAREMREVLAGKMDGQAVFGSESSHPHQPPVAAELPGRKPVYWPGIGIRPKVVCDEKGRVVRRINEFGEEFEYIYHPKSGKLILTLGSQTRTAYHYDEQGNLTRAETNDGRIIHLEYGTSPLIRRIVEINRAENTRRDMRFKYNAAGKPVEIHLVGLGRIFVAYDAEGEIAKVRSTRGARMALQVLQAFQNMLGVIQGARNP